MRVWLFYCAVVFGFAIIVSIPLRFYPDRDERDELREKVYRIERKLDRVDRMVTNQRNPIAGVPPLLPTTLEQQSTNQHTDSPGHVRNRSELASAESFPVNKMAMRHCSNLELKNLLRLSHTQEEAIAQILRFWQASGATQDVCEILTIREKILQVLTPQQRQEYLVHLKETNSGF